MSNFTNSSSLPEESDWVPTISHMPGQPVPVGTEKYQELCILVSPDHFTFTIMCWQEWYKCYLGGGQVIFTDGSVVDILQHHFTTTKKTRKVFFFQETRKLLAFIDVAHMRNDFGILVFFSFKFII